MITVTSCIIQKKNVIIKYRKHEQHNILIQYNMECMELNICFEKIDRNYKNKSHKNFLSMMYIR